MYLSLPITFVRKSHPVTSPMMSISHFLVIEYRVVTHTYHDSWWEQVCPCSVDVTNVSKMDSSTIAKILQYSLAMFNHHDCVEIHSQMLALSRFSLLGWLLIVQGALRSTYMYVLHGEASAYIFLKTSIFVRYKCREKLRFDIGDFIASLCSNWFWLLLIFF